MPHRPRRSSPPNRRQTVREPRATSCRESSSSLIGRTRAAPVGCRHDVRPTAHLRSTRTSNAWNERPKRRRWVWVPASIATLRARWRAFVESDPERARSCRRARRARTRARRRSARAPHGSARRATATRRCVDARPSLLPCSTHAPRGQQWSRSCSRSSMTTTRSSPKPPRSRSASSRHARRDDDAVERGVARVGARDGRASRSARRAKPRSRHSARSAIRRRCPRCSRRRATSPRCAGAPCSPSRRSTVPRSRPPSRPRSPTPTGRSAKPPKTSSLLGRDSHAFATSANDASRSRVQLRDRGRSPKRTEQACDRVTFWRRCGP